MKGKRQTFLSSAKWWLLKTCAFRREHLGENVGGEGFISVYQAPCLCPVQLDSGNTKMNEASFLGSVR